MSKKDKPPFLPSPNYDVGYGKPPRDTRFPKGRSGNPAGRPKGAVSRRYDGGVERLFEAIEREAGREVMIRDGAREVTMTMLDAILRTTMVKAVQGSARHAELAIKIVSNKEAQERRQHERLLEQMIAYKVAGEDELARRQRLGITDLSDLTPHPDDILIDFDDGSVTITGPMTEQERGERDAELAAARERVEEWHAERQAALASLEVHCAELSTKDEDNPKLRAILVDARQKIDAQYAQLRDVLNA